MLRLKSNRNYREKKLNAVLTVCDPPCQERVSLSQMPSIKLFILRAYPRELNVSTVEMNIIAPKIAERLLGRTITEYFVLARNLQQIILC